MWFVTYVTSSGLGQGGCLGACHQPLWDDWQLHCYFSTELHLWFLNQDLSPRLEPKGLGLGQLLCSLKSRQCFCFASCTSIPMVAFQVKEKKACIIIFFQGLIEKNAIKDNLGTFFLVFHRNRAPAVVKIRSTQGYKLVASSLSVAFTLCFSIYISVQMILESSYRAFFLTNVLPIPLCSDYLF